LRTPYPYP